MKRLAGIRKTGALVGRSLAAACLWMGNGSSFGMSDLHARPDQMTSGTSTPVVGPVANGHGPVVNVLSLWTGQSGLDNGPVEIDFYGLTTAGTYVLDVAGTATGGVPMWHEGLTDPERYTDEAPVRILASCEFSALP